MNQIGKHIIFVINTDNVVLERSDIYFNTRARQHFDHCCFQTIKIHIDERHNSIIRGSARPIALKFSIRHQADHCIRIVHMIISQLVTVIPALHLFKIPMILVTQAFYLFLCKTNIRSKRSCSYHGIQFKIIQCRLRYFFFNR